MQYTIFCITVLSFLIMSAVAIGLFVHYSADRIQVVSSWQLYCYGLFSACLLGSIDVHFLGYILPSFLNTILEPDSSLGELLKYVNFFYRKKMSS